MAHLPIEKTRVYEMTCELSDEVYQLVRQWDTFSRQTIGGQLVRALDSIGANLVEGDSRGSDLDSLRFFRYARGSAREARYWVERASKRSLVTEEKARDLQARITDCGKMLSGLMEFRSDPARNQFVKEELATYSVRGKREEPAGAWDEMDFLTEQPIPE